MIALVSNANSKLNGLILQDGVISHYKLVCDIYTKGYIQTFITNMQNLITKVGILMSKASTKHENISYCAQSISYLCSKVLDKPTYIKKFNELGLNEKGNHGKHDITTNKINLEQVVNLYNGVLNEIMTKYQLTSLKILIIRKVKTDEPNVNVSQPKPKPQLAPIKNTGPSKKKANNRANEQTTLTDEKLTLHASLERGDGRYKKGLFKKTDMVNFILLIDLKNPDHLKIKSITATMKCGRNVRNIDINTNLYKKTNIDLPTKEFSGNIEAKIVVIYKIGLFKTKQISVTVSKIF